MIGDEALPSADRLETGKILPLPEKLVPTAGLRRHVSVDPLHGDGHVDAALCLQRRLPLFER
jgi:hypothetical protein